MPNHIHAIVFIDDNRVSPCRDGVHTVSVVDNQLNTNKNEVHTVSSSAPSKVKGDAISGFEYNPLDGMGDGVHTVSTAKMENNRWKYDVVDETMQFISKQKGRLSVVIGGLKRAVTHYANQTSDYFAWQTRFHDRIIRDQPEMNRIAFYIENNVANWEEDEFYTPRQ